MTLRRTLAVLLLLTLAGLAFSLWAYPRLPALVPSHWNAAGEIDGYMPRAAAAVLLPAMALGLGLLLLYLPNIDPLRANVERFRRPYHWFVAGLALFLLLLHALTLLAGLGVRFNMTSLVIPITGLSLIGLGFLIERTRPNWFIGIRTPWTLTSPTVWARTHRLGARLFKLGGAAALLGLLLPPQAALLLLMALVLLLTLATVIYSYVVYREEREKENR